MRTRLLKNRNNRLTILILQYSQTELVDVLPRSPVDRPDMYMQIYLISAVLAVIPLLAWRMFGRLDGTGLIDLTEGTPSNQRLSSAIW